MADRVKAPALRRPSSNHNQLPVVVQEYLEVVLEVVALVEVLVSRSRSMLPEGWVKVKELAVLEDH